MIKQALYSLPSGLVLDNNVLATLTTAETSDTIKAIRAEGDKPLAVINSAEAFFTQQHLVDLIAHKDVTAKLLNEHLKLFNDEQMALLLGGGHQQDDELVVGIGEMPVAAGYTFAPIPAGWSIGNNMSLGMTKIKRKIKNPEGDGTMFFMSPADYKFLWEFASQAWAGIPGAKDTEYFNTGIGKKQAVVQDDRISIGGNFIRRYEIEQVAKHRGWSVPAAAKIAANDNAA